MTQGAEGGLGDAGKETRWARVHKFLNSPLGLWLLGTVALGLVSQGYLRVEKSLQASNEKVAIERKLDAELTSRAMQFTYWFERERLTLVQDPNGPIRLGDALRALRGPSAESTQAPPTTLRIYGVYPDLKDRPMTSLVLGRLVTLEEEWREVRRDYPTSRDCKEAAKAWLASIFGPGARECRILDKHTALQLLSVLLLRDDMVPVDREDQSKWQAAVGQVGVLFDRFYPTFAAKD